MDEDENRIRPGPIKNSRSVSISSISIMSLNFYKFKLIIQFFFTFFMSKMDE